MTTWNVHWQRSLCTVGWEINVPFQHKNKPTVAAVSSKHRVFSCMWPKEWDSSARSSAYSKSSKLLPEIQWMPVDLPFIVCLVTQSITNRNRNGDNMQPCRVPFFTLEGSVSPRPWITLHTESLYWHVMILISFSGTPWYLRIFY